MSQFAEGDEGLLQLASPDSEEDADNLGFAAAMVSQLAGRVFGTLDESCIVQFLDLNLELLEAMDLDLEPLRQSVEEGRPPPWAKGD